MSRPLLTNLVAKLILNDDIHYLQLLYANNPNLVFEIDSHGNTALHIACEYRREQIALFLIEKMVAVPRVFDAANELGITALHIACLHDMVRLVDRLLMFDVNTSIEDYQHHWTPLHFACSENNVECATLLVQRNPHLLTQWNQSGEIPWELLFEETISIKVLDEGDNNYLLFREAKVQSKFSFQSKVFGKLYKKQRISNKEYLHIIYEEVLSRSRLIDAISVIFDGATGDFESQINGRFDPTELLISFWPVYHKRRQLQTQEDIWLVFDFYSKEWRVQNHLPDSEQDSFIFHSSSMRMYENVMLQQASRQLFGSSLLCYAKYKCPLKPVRNLPFELNHRFCRAVAPEYCNTVNFNRNGQSNIDYFGQWQVNSGVGWFSLLWNRYQFQPRISVSNANPMSNTVDRTNSFDFPPMSPVSAQRHNSLRGQNSEECAKNNGISSPKNSPISVSNTSKSWLVHSPKANQSDEIPRDVHNVSGLDQSFETFEIEEKLEKMKLSMSQGIEASKKDVMLLHSDMFTVDETSEVDSANVSAFEVVEEDLNSSFESSSSSKMSTPLRGAMIKSLCRSLDSIDAELDHKDVTLSSHSFDSYDAITNTNRSLIVTPKRAHSNRAKFSPTCSPDTSAHLYATQGRLVRGGKRWSSGNNKLGQHDGQDISSDSNNRGQNKSNINPNHLSPFGSNQVAKINTPERYHEKNLDGKSLCNLSNNPASMPVSGSSLPLSSPTRSSPFRNKKTSIAVAKLVTTLHELNTKEIESIEQCEKQRRENVAKDNNDHLAFFKAVFFS